MRERKNRDRRDSYPGGLGIGVDTLQRYWGEEGGGRALPRKDGRRSGPFMGKCLSPQGANVHNTGWG